MVDVGHKPVTHRTAVARAVITLSPETLSLLVGGKLPKGDAIQVARIAAIMAVKKTSELIPLCHPIPLSGIDVEIEPVGDRSLAITVEVRNTAQTGVEMEALTGCSVGALTIYDMIKAVEPGAVIEEIKLLKKSGGKSGDWIHPTYSGG